MVDRIVRRRVLGVVVETHPVVFPVSAILVVSFVIVTAAWPNRAQIFCAWLQGEIASRFAWFYVLAMTGFLLFAVYLCLSRYGSIRLGPDDEPPEFSTLSWFSMLFSAGMGIGMLFFGVAEPVWHFGAPPAGPAGTIEAAEQAMGLTLFHWCLHPWALYALVALSLAYFSFRRGLPLSFRSTFYPLLGKRIYGPLGDLIDVMAVLATLFGLATSLGLGAKQVNAGLSYLFGLPQHEGMQLLLIACITAMAVASLVSGLDVGIRRLSELNMVMAGLLLLFLFIAGPSVYLLSSLVENSGAYLQQLPRRSFHTAAYGDPAATTWLHQWTVFYWGWWIAWCPFVGMFIARVSKGRTIREFILGVVVLPSAVAVVWMTGFGNSALHQELHPSEHVAAATVGDGLQDAKGTYAIQVIDHHSGLPMSADGEWLVGPHSQLVASPIGVMMQQADNGLVTKQGEHVGYHRGVLVYQGTTTPFRLTPEVRYAGAYRARTDQLTLSGYLSEPVLTDDHASLVDTTATAMFVMLSAYPFSSVTAFIGTLSVLLFFVTSSDSASLVADIITSGGNHNPTLGTRIFWGVLEGVLAGVLLLAGGLKALQTGSITIGLPFAAIVVVMCVSLLCGLRQESNTQPERDDARHPLR